MVRGTLPGHLITRKPHLVLRALSNHDDSVRAVVCVVPTGLRVDEEFAAAVLALRPTLAQHVCKQRGFGLFGDTLIGTTLPHLVEHVAIDLLVEDEPHPHPRAGTTTWLDREQGIMEIRLSCNTSGGNAGGDSTSDAAAPDTEVTRTAIIRAVALVNTLLTR